MYLDKIDNFGFTDTDKEKTDGVSNKSVAVLLVRGSAVTFLHFLMTGKLGVSIPGDWK